MTPEVSRATGLDARILAACSREYGVEITQEQIEGLKARWLDSFPEMRRLLEQHDKSSPDGDRQRKVR